jgi:hypothetical protein
LGHFSLIENLRKDIAHLIALKALLFPFFGHSSPAIISAIIKNITNIPMFPGGSYQEFIIAPGIEWILIRNLQFVFQC